MGTPPQPPSGGFSLRQAAPSGAEPGVPGGAGSLTALVSAATLWQRRRFLTEASGVVPTYLSIGPEGRLALRHYARAFTPGTL